MPIIYRSEKGGPLSIEEMDNNFYQLAQRLEQLEGKSFHAEGIGKIQQDGDQLTIIGDRGTVFGPFRLPIVPYTPRGEWGTQTDYAAFDVVSYTGNAYVCLRPHSSAKFQTDQTYWKLLFQAIPHQAPSPAQSPKSCLTVYEPQTLPKVAELGQLAAYVDHNAETVIIFSDGRCWRHLATNQIVKERHEQ